MIVPGGSGYPIRLRPGSLDAPPQLVWSGMVVLAELFSAHKKTMP